MLFLPTPKIGQSTYSFEEQFLHTDKYRTIFCEQKQNAVWSSGLHILCVAFLIGYAAGCKKICAHTWNNTRTVQKAILSTFFPLWAALLKQWRTRSKLVKGTCRHLGKWYTADFLYGTSCSKYFLSYWSPLEQCTPSCPFPRLHETTIHEVHELSCG